ncbi:hypothetical protein VKT23_013867, partial [Stygiomarasmius scandens]
SSILTVDIVISMLWHTDYTPQAAEASVPPTALIPQPLPPPPPLPLPGSPIVIEPDMEAINNLTQQLASQQLETQ